MKATFDRQGLLDAALIAAPVAAKKSPKPILQDLYLEVGDDKVTLTGSDTEISVTVWILGVDVTTPGVAVLPAEKALAVLKSSEKDSRLVLSADDEHVRMNALGAKFRFAAPDVRLYPVPASFDAEDYFAVAAADLKRAIRRTVFATEPESTRYAMGGVLFEFEEDRLRCVATDGRRMGVQEVTAEVEGNPVLPGSIVVPAKACGIIGKLLDDDDPPVHLAFANNSILVRAHSAVVVARLVEGRFPKWQQLLPEKVKAAVPFDVRSLRTRLEQAAITTSKESFSVDIALSQGQLSLSSGSPDLGTSDVQMAFGFDDEPVGVRLHPGYLIDALKVLPDETPASIRVQGPEVAVLLETGDGYTYVAMPMSKEVK